MNHFVSTTPFFGENQSLSATAVVLTQFVHVPFECVIALRPRPSLSRTLPGVPETFLARFPVSVKSFSRLRPTTEDASAFGQQREFLPHA